MAETTREDREAAARALFGGENWRRWKPTDREYDRSVEHWVDRGAEAGSGFCTLELVTRIRAESAAAEAKAIAGYLAAMAGSYMGASKRLLETAAADIERGEHRKVAL